MSRGPFQTSLLSFMAAMRSCGLAGTRIRSGESPAGRDGMFAAIIVELQVGSSGGFNVQMFKCAEVLSSS